MLRILHADDRGRGAPDELERHARYLFHEAERKNKLPRVSGATRALVPDWCDSCGERAWGQANGYCLCPRCRGEGKTPMGFAARRD